jgi:hypothetical protein
MDGTEENLEFRLSWTLGTRDGASLFYSLADNKGVLETKGYYRPHTWSTALKNGQGFPEVEE